jgi:hypothetical protein
VFHVELRQFPHNAVRFNLDEAELLALVEPWASGRWIELGERKWSPHHARLTVLEGPRLSVQELSLSRGWRNAVRQGEDVTEQMVARASESAAEGTAAEATAAGAGQPRVAPAEVHTGTLSGNRSAADGYSAAELLALLGDDPRVLLAAWQLVAARRPELSPSEALALAEDTLESLGESRS